VLPVKPVPVRGPVLAMVLALAASALELAPVPHS